MPIELDAVMPAVVSGHPEFLLRLVSRDRLLFRQKNPKRESLLRNVGHVEIREEND